MELTGSARACLTNSLVDRCSASPLLAQWCISRSCCWRTSRQEISTQTGKLILRLLRRIASQRTAIVMATHSMEAAGVADTVVRMRDGGIEEVIGR